MDLREAIATFRSHRQMLAERGISWQPGLEPVGYNDPRTIGRNYQLAMDALPDIPTLTTDPNSSVPAMLTSFIDPEVYKALFAPNAISEIVGEERRGNWLTDTDFLPIAEATGEVSSYGDFSNNGRAGVNTNWPQVQNYLFQVIKEYGERELERAGLARINWVAEIDYAAALNLSKFANFAYAFGVSGLQNYGLLNNPYLTAALTPAPKAYGGTAWTNSSNVVVAQANEIFTDIQSLVIQLVLQNPGLVTNDSEMTLALSPLSFAALTATNTFNVNVRTLLTNNFPNLKINGRAVQYQAKSSSNPQGIAGGNYMQLIATRVEGQKTAYCAFSEKMRAFKIIPELSAWKQKQLSGVWGTITRQPSGISQMLGI
jgi:Uncharacterized protein conserved in bacteria (DUF2184)